MAAALLIVVAVAGVTTAILIVLNARARARLEQLGGDPGDPARRHWWMRFGG